MEGSNNRSVATHQDKFRKKEIKGTRMDADGFQVCSFKVRKFEIMSEQGNGIKAFFPLGGQNEPNVGN